jgi:gluconolactonase
MRLSLFFAFIIAASLMVSCGDQQPASNDNDQPKDSTTVVENTKIRILDPEGNDLIDSTAKIEKLAEGFKWTEGPLYISDGEYLLFSDIPNNRVMKWKEGEGLSTYLQPSGFTPTDRKAPEKEAGSNGLLLDGKGNLVLCQHGDRRVARMMAPLSDPKPVFETVADKYKGRRFNSPNDAIYDSKGNLYITDPSYGLDKGDDDTAKELSFHGVFRVTPAGKVDILDSSIKWPNGITLTPDEKYLLVGYSNGENPVWMKYELNKDGLAASKSVFYKITPQDQDVEGGPDGMKMSKKGYLFASGPGGIWIINPSGKPVARIYTGQATSNCALSTDEKTLYMTCDHFLYKVKLK